MSDVVKATGQELDADAAADDDVVCDPEGGCGAEVPRAEAVAMQDDRGDFYLCAECAADWERHARDGVTGG